MSKQFRFICFLFTQNESVMSFISPCQLLSETNGNAVQIADWRLAFYPTVAAPAALAKQLK